MGRICVKKWGMNLPEGFASYSLLNGADICGEGTESFQVVWQTEIEVELERTKKKLRGVIAPISTPNDYLDTVVDDVVSPSWSQKNAFPRSPRKSFNLMEYSPCV